MSKEIKELRTHIQNMVDMLVYQSALKHLDSWAEYMITTYDWVEDISVGVENA